MLFTQDAVAGLRDGTITLTFRRWKRPQVRAGGRYRTWDLLLEVDDLSQVRSSDITDDDARRAGSASAADLVSRLGGDPDSVIWRVAFHYVGPDDRIARRSDVVLDDGRWAQIEARLHRMDRAAAGGPWTRRTLRLIATYPGVVSTALARHAGAERMAFKADVRKLKELGLTESLTVGYRLSPLGEAFLAHAAEPGDPPVEHRT